MIRALVRYASLHAQNALASLGRLVRQPVATTMTVLVIAIAIALPAGLRVLVGNAATMSAAWERAADFTVYLKLDIGDERARALAAEVGLRDDVESVDFISREAALAEFRERSGFGDVLDALDGNPLPHALLVRPASGAQGDIETLAGALAALPETELVQIDTAWVERLRAILALAGRVVDVATVLLAAAVVLVIGNTIRLEINNRSTEIEVMKLVGGSDGFIRRPFLYLGFWYGFAGAVAAWLLIGITLWLLSAPVGRLAALYDSAFALTGLAGRDLAALIGGGALLGWAGAGLATARHLRAIEPR
jgi:cell division transport system permease protein